MTVQDATRTVSVPRQAEPVDPPLATPAPATPVPDAPVPAAAPLLGRDRPLTTDERDFARGLAALFVVLGTIIVVGLLLGQYAWT